MLTCQAKLSVSPTQDGYDVAWWDVVTCLSGASGTELLCHTVRRWTNSQIEQINIFLRAQFSLFLENMKDTQYILLGYANTVIFW